MQASTLQYRYRYTCLAYTYQYRYWVRTRVPVPRYYGLLGTGSHAWESQHHVPSIRAHMPVLEDTYTRVLVRGYTVYVQHVYYLGIIFCNIIYTHVSSTCVYGCDQCKTKFSSMSLCWWTQSSKTIHTYLVVQSCASLTGTLVHSSSSFHVVGSSCFFLSASTTFSRAHIDINGFQFSCFWFHRANNQANNAALK